MGRFSRTACLVLAALFSFSQTIFAADEAPQFQIDPFWPKTLPHNWILGRVAGIYVDSRNHIWISQRPDTLDPREIFAETMPNVECCFAAPHIIEFDPQGNVVQAWQGPGEGHDWPENEHGIYVDHNGFVWLAGNGPEDGFILKYTNDGRFVMQIGRQGPQTGSLDTTRLGRPADMIVDPENDELYVADGYGNHRVIVFDAATGEFKRMWGAYGNPPTDRAMPPFDPEGDPPQQFTNPVHCIRLSNDGLVFVCDRGHNRIQVFEKDGTFVREYFIHPKTRPATTGSVAFWPDAEQSLFLTSDDSNGKIRISRRGDGVEIGAFGKVGNMTGEFNNLHNIAIDSQGNVYTAEVEGKRIQKFVNLSGID
jgi:DNA-binding beta-propeller fold protein YncE